MPTSTATLPDPMPPAGAPLVRGSWWQRWRTGDGAGAPLNAAALAELQQRLNEAAQHWTAHVGMAQQQMNAATGQLLDGFHQILA